MYSSPEEDYVDPLRIEDCAEFPLGGGWTLQGYSLGGVRTGFRIKELKILLDAGVACDSRSNGILLSHCHQDHTSRRRTKVFANGRCAALVQPFMEAMQALSDEPDETKIGCDFVVAEPGDELFGIPGVPDVRVATFRCHHRTESNAYGLYMLRHKLRQELKGLPSKELAELKRSGEEITEDVLQPILLFCGDTTYEFFEDPTNVQQEAKEGREASDCRYPTDVWGFPNILIECTMIDRAADDKGHMGLDRLGRHIQEHPETTFIVMHQSPRYHVREIIEVFQSQGFGNVVLWNRGQVFDLRRPPKWTMIQKDRIRKDDGSHF